MSHLRGETRRRSKTKDGRFIDMHGGSVQDLIDAASCSAARPIRSSPDRRILRILRRHGQPHHDGPRRQPVA